MPGVTGNFAGLAQLQEAVRSAMTPTLMVNVSQAMGAAAMKKLADGFLQSRDPYGTPWAPLKLRSGKPLLATGRMRASASVQQAPGGGFTMSITAAYAATHQYGATIRPRRARMLSWQVRGGQRFFAKQVTIPKRGMIPDEGRPAPLWMAAMQASADATVREHFLGRTP